MISKTADSLGFRLLRKSTPVAGLAGKYIAKPVAGAAWRATKGVSGMGYLAAKGLYRTNVGIGKGIARHETMRNIAMPGLALSGMGLYNAPKKIKANMVHVNPNSENMTRYGWKGIKFSSPEHYKSIKNIDMLY